MRPPASYDARDLRVIDDFYADPFAVRRYIIEREADFTALPEENFPGRVLVDTKLLQESMPRFEALTGVPLRVSNHSIRSATAAEWPHRRSVVHLDDVPFTFVVYLGIVDADDPYREHPEYGTVLYSHRATGFDRIVRASDAGYDAFLREHGLTAPGHEALMRQLVADMADESAWREECVVPYRFNRLVAHRANVMFHSGPSSSFGVDLASSRITQNTFTRYDGLRLLAREVELQQRCIGPRHDAG